MKPYHERMASAVEAVSTGSMSVMGAARHYCLSDVLLARHLQAALVYSVAA